MQKSIDEKTSLRKNGKTERINVTDFQASLSETSSNKAQNSNVTDSNTISSGVTPHLITMETQIRQKNLIQLTPVLEAEKCELCGEFPVKYEFVVDGQPIRRCQHCIDTMKSEGMKFTTLTEVNQKRE